MLGLRVRALVKRPSILSHVPDSILVCVCVCVCDCVCVCVCDQRDRLKKAAEDLNCIKVL